MMKEKLIDIIVSKSLQVADRPIFELSSGKKSEIYIDCKKTTCNGKGKFLIGNLIFDMISHLNIDAIGGLTLGADPIASAVSLIGWTKGHLINAFVVRKAPKGHGLQYFIEGDVKKGNKVIIVDDVVTTGGSTIEAIQKARKFGLDVIKTIVLVDRQEGGRENILKENVAFDAIVTKEELLAIYYRTNRTNKLNLRSD
ncbi:MAG: orotate phosphoribosyltransferase [Nitrospirota bacterium]